MPTKGSTGSAGHDIYSTQSATIPPGQRKLISTGISMECPNGTYGRIAPRLGLAVKYGIDTLGGVIDKDFRGEIKVILINHGKQDLSIKTGDRIAQMIFEQNSDETMREVTSLTATKQQNKGFGSTGVSE